MINWEPAIVMKIEVDVDDDWTKTVIRMPIMSPQKGLFNKSCTSLRI